MEIAPIFSKVTAKIFSSWKKYFRKFEPNQFCYLSSNKSPIIWDFVISLARKKIEHLNFCCPLLFTKWAEDQIYVLRNGGISKQLKKNNRKFSISMRQKSALFLRKSALNQRYSTLIFSSEILFFQWCSELTQRFLEVFR